jgi:type IV pilus assembly protein PilY1
MAVRGWYMDLPEPGERVLSNGLVLGRMWLQPSGVPAHSAPTDPADAGFAACEAPLREAVSAEYLLDIFSGAPAAWPAFDTDGGGFTGTELADISGWRSGPQARTWQRLAGSEVLSLGRGAPMRLRMLGGPSARMGWRQLQ